MQRFWIVAALSALTVAGFVWFPGHTYLYQDTQIWVPVMEWMAGHRVLDRDLLVEAAHMRLTFYDDLAINLKRLTGADFQSILQALQLVFRLAGLAGVFLLARSATLSIALSLMAAALFGMGATIMGPSVLSVELEPVPRGFAFPLALLGLGCIAQHRERAGGLAIAGGFLFHAPAIWPVLLIPPWRKKVWAPVAVAGMILAVSAALAQSSQLNPFFGAVSPAHEELQRMRASYNWITVWAPIYLSQHIWLTLIAAAAYSRIRWDLPEAIRPYLKWLPWLGLACVPVSYVLLEKFKWNLMPQVQPMRALLYTTALAVILCSIAGLRAAAKGHWWEAPVWLVLPCLIPLSPDLSRGPYWIPLALALGVAALALATRRWPQLAPVAVVAVGLALVALPLTWAKVRNYRKLETPELEQLITWARVHTGPRSLFVFRDYGRNDPNHPGIFRGRALRPLWVDFKGGGQVNYYEKWSFEWWRRWRLVEKPFAAEEWDQWRREQVDYLIFQRLPADVTPVFANARYAVVAVPR